jgi:hypothetical protein
MSELEFFLLMGALTQTFNIKELTKFLEKIKDFKFKSKRLHQDDIIQNHEKQQKLKEKRSENLGFYGQKKHLFWCLAL